MEIKIAKTAGFCFGVKKAVDRVYEEIAIQEQKECLKKEKKQPQLQKDKKKPENSVKVETISNVYTYGEIIHNETVVQDLAKHGVRVISNKEELNKVTEGTIIIRSHGVDKEVYQIAQKQNLKMVDATCPFVKKIHRIVEEQEKNGRTIIIIGNDSHPEVAGIKGWCVNKPIILETVEEANHLELPYHDSFAIVSQTTFNYKKFKDIVEIISKKGYDILVLNTICNATEERQKEAMALSKEADAMIVIGGTHSSNTQKLFEVCKKECVNTYYIQTLNDLDLNIFKSFRCVGITAGASTPNYIIEEVHTSMAELSFEQLLEEESLVTIHNGEVVEGTVIDVKEEEIILNIGYKADGIITKNEYSNTPVDLTTVVKPGDVMQAKVLKVNDGDGQVLLTYKRLAAEKGNKRLEEAYNNKEVLKAKVNQVLDGGLSVIVDEARIFIPASLVSDTYEKNLQKYAGQEIEFVISEFNPKRRRIIGDRKQLLVAKKQEMQKALFEKISVGMTVEGTVKNVTDFGAFIDLGGADGLLHISEMSWGRIENPKKVFKVGEPVKVLIKDITGEKIALSLKFEDQNPWLKAAEKYASGTVITGKVARMTDFGAFVELEPGVDALLHVSQISKEHVEKPADVLKIGQEITAKVVDFNEESKKISLSIKALEVSAAPTTDTEKAENNE